MKPTTSTEPTGMQAGVARNGEHWTGVIRLGKAVIWRCPHLHNNRHECTGTNPISAYKCSSTVLQVFQKPETVAIFEQWLNGAYFSRAYQYQLAKVSLNLKRWAETQRGALAL